MNMTSASTTRSRNAGFSFIELLIATLLGGIIILASVELFSTNQRTFQLQSGLTDVQEQGRFALDFISREIRMMGYEDEDLGLADDAGLVRADITIGGTTYTASAEGGTGNPGNDRFTFSKQGDIGTSDCEGDVLTAAALIVQTYWVQDDQLFCMGSVNAATTGIAMLTGIDSFQVLIGVDTSADGVPAAGTYKTINNVTATDQIVSVRLGIVVRATQGNMPTPAASRDLLVLDRMLSASAGGPLATPAVRRVFVTTVRVRNLVWESI